MNINKQIEYWKSGSISDIETAEILLDKGKYLHGLFFCHLATEKILKANYVKHNKSVAPKTHDLIYLTEHSELELEEKYLEFLPVLMKYQLEGRYPDYSPLIPSKEKLNDYLSKTKDLLLWLTQKL